MNRIDTKFLTTMCVITLVVGFCALMSRDTFLGFGVLAMVWVIFGYVIGCLEPVKPRKSGEGMPIRIVCAANRYPFHSMLSDNRFIVVPSARHFDLVMHRLLKQIFGGAGYPVEEQGFIDQHGNFYTREQAYQVAKDAGQIIRRCGGDDGRLYSENLY